MLIFLDSKNFHITIDVLYDQFFHPRRTETSFSSYFIKWFPYSNPYDEIFTSITKHTHLEWTVKLKTNSSSNSTNIRYALWISLRHESFERHMLNDLKTKAIVMVMEVIKWEFMCIKSLFTFRKYLWSFLYIMSLCSIQCCLEWHQMVKHIFSNFQTIHTKTHKYTYMTDNRDE